MTTEAPAPPSNNPQWRDPKIVLWRNDAAKLRDQLIASGQQDCIEHNDSWTTAYLRHYGVKQITEEVVLLMWIMLPFLESFINARVRRDHPGGSQLITMLVERGLDFAGIELLYLEQRIGEVL